MKGKKIMVITEAPREIPQPDGDYELNGICYTVSGGQVFLNMGILIKPALDMDASWELVKQCVAEDIKAGKGDKIAKIILSQQFFVSMIHNGHATFDQTSVVIEGITYPTEVRKGYRYRYATVDAQGEVV